jgi:hypothetical protein
LAVEFLAAAAACGWSGPTSPTDASRLAGQFIYVVRPTL